MEAEQLLCGIGGNPRLWPGEASIFHIFAFMGI